jgi:uncharacterized C2H2 Zn-finger protein
MARKFDLSSEIRGALRRLFRFSPHRKEAMKRARVELLKYKKNGTKAKRPSVFYKCFKCEQLFKETSMEVHHINKVGPHPGSKNAHPSLTWNEFIRRMFCPPEFLRATCKPCHAKLTKEGK